MVQRARDKPPKARMIEAVNAVPRYLSDQLVEVVRNRILSGAVSDTSPIRQFGRDERANEEHKEPFDVWLARDVERLKALTRDHILKTLDDLRLQIAKD